MLPAWRAAFRSLAEAYKILLMYCAVGSWQTQQACQMAG